MSKFTLLQVVFAIHRRTDEIVAAYDRDPAPFHENPEAAEAFLNQVILAMLFSIAIMQRLREP
jgi:acyl dehydratase